MIRCIKNLRILNLRISFMIIGFCILLNFAGFLSCGGSSKRVLRLYNWTYYIPDETLEDFEKETGIKVILDTYDTNETMYSKLITGNANYDIVVPSSDYVSLMIEQDMLSKIDYNKIPNFENLSPKVLDFANKVGYDKDYQYSVLYFIGSSGISINTKFVQDDTNSWRIFGRKDLKNRMSMLNDMRDVIGGALMTLGFSGNSRDKSELDQAKKLILEEWKPNLLKFDSETFGKDFSAENIWVAQGFPEVVLNERERNRENYKFVLPKEGSMINVDSMVILKNAKNKDEAHALINYLLRPEVHAYIADIFYFPVLIPEAELYKKDSPAYDLNILMEHGEVRRGIGSDVSLYTAIWDQILQGS